MHSTMHLTPVDAADIPQYPIEKGERLESHFFLEFHFNRWLSSDFRLLADPEVRAYGFDLFCLAQNQDPVGTLPDDDRLLAKLLGVDLHAWQGVRGRDVGPLHHWDRVQCSDGSVRLAHPVVTEMAVKALSARRGRVAANMAARQRKRWERLREQLPQAGAHSSVAGNPALVEWVDDWLEANCSGNRTVEMVRSALEAHSIQAK